MHLAIYCTCKVIDLEEKLVQISSAGSNTRKFADSGAKGGALLPCPPAKAVLVGHRSPVNCLSVHPVYSICASGSEDATVRIWDTDSATHERTLRGHSNSVQVGSSQEINVGHFEALLYFF